jgi:luciferase family oxidoreductase group 1
MAIPFSILDLAPIVEGGTAAGALQNTLDFARHAERYGYHRYWLAEHHNMPGVASAATAILIAHVAGGTRSIRVGSGGTMLPNYAPLIVAEQFGTLETTLSGAHRPRTGARSGGLTCSPPVRCDGTSKPTNAPAFADDALKLRHFFEACGRGQAIRAIPGAGLQVAVFILGSSLFGASVAGHVGLALCVRFTTIRNRSLASIVVVQRIFQTGRPNSVLQRSAMPAHRLNWHPPQTATFPLEDRPPSY